MTSKRDLAARLLGRIGVVRISTTLRARVGSAVTILAYHRILDVPDEGAFPFDVELVSASSEAFERQMRYVRRHCSPITFETLLGHLDAGESLPRNATIVTFDDGFADNYTYAFPILQRLGVPATIFVSTGYLDCQEHFWYERVAHAVMTSKMASLTSPEGRSIPLPSPPAGRRRVVAALLSALKLVPNAVRLGYLQALDRELDHGVDCGGDLRSGPMTWEQAREMSSAGIEFGSHTVSHPVLSRLEPWDLTRELNESKSRLEEMLGKSAVVIAYPVGGREAISEGVLEATRAAGYRLGATYIPGVQSPTQWKPFELRRVHIERYVDDDLFRASIAFPSVFVR